MTAYFAYGSNMDPKQMEQRCPGAEPRGPARLVDHRLVFVWDSPGWGGGVGHVERAQGEEVWGVLWEVTDEHLASLDEYEGVANGVYRRARAVVNHEGEQIRALLYLALDRVPKPPSARYLHALIRGAKVYGLPDPYVTSLAALMPVRAADRID